jgi:hypothetical protein
VYPLSALRYLTSNNPTKIRDAAVVGHPNDPTRIDKSMHALLAFPSSVTGELYVDFAMPGWGPFGILPKSLKTGVTIELEEGTVELSNFPVPHVFNKITIRPKHGAQHVERVYRFKSGFGEQWWST